jgi:hypothetical protein
MDENFKLWIKNTSTWIKNEKNKLKAFHVVGSNWCQTCPLGSKNHKNRK